MYKELFKVQKVDKNDFLTHLNEAQQYKSENYSSEYDSSD